MKTNRTAPFCLAKLFSLLVLLALPAAVQAQYTFTTNNGAITITGYTGPGGTVTIPDTINGLPVRVLASGAFTNQGGLTNVTIPDSVGTIENGAFSYCSNLLTAVIGQGVTNIGLGFVSFSSVGGAFYPCTNLTEIIVSPLNSKYSSLDGVLFSKNQAALLVCPGGRTGSLIIPEGVTGIANWAFSDCLSLTSVTIPSAITNLTIFAPPTTFFSFCANLTEINVSPSNTVFSSVDGIVLNKAQTQIIDCPKGRTELHTIPSTVTAIGQYAFSGRGKLTSITIPNSVASIGPEAFYASGLINLTIPDSVTNLWNSVFAQCTKLKSVTIGSGLQYLGSYAFEGCTNLSSVTFSPNANLISISGWAFASCALTNVTLPDSLTSLTDGAFIRCGNLQSVTIGSSVTNIGTMWSGTFTLCSNLTAVYCQGNAPSGTNAFAAATNAVVYYLPGTTGWGTTFSGQPTALWKPSLQSRTGISGPPTNPFGFDINWASGTTVVVEACTDLANPVWVPLSTNVLTGGSASFSDPEWNNYPSRVYRAAMLPGGP